jgi:hypothetical protein
MRPLNNNFSIVVLRNSKPFLHVFFLIFMKKVNPTMHNIGLYGNQNQFLHISFLIEH